MARLSAAFSGSIVMSMFDSRMFSIGRSAWPTMVLVPRGCAMTLSTTMSRMAPRRDVGRALLQHELAHLGAAPPVPMAPAGLDGEVADDDVADGGAVLHVDAEALVRVPDDAVVEQDVPDVRLVSVPIISAVDDDVSTQLVTVTFSVGRAG